MTIYSQPSGSSGTGDYIGNKSFIIMLVDVRRSPFQFARGRGVWVQPRAIPSFSGFGLLEGVPLFFEGGCLFSDCRFCR